jgi:hypothetical protein
VISLFSRDTRLRRPDNVAYLAAPTARGESAEPYESYLAVFRHGMPPHGGFALGPERWTARLIGADNIRRSTGRAGPLKIPTPRQYDGPARDDGQLQAGFRVPA